MKYNYALDMAFEFVTEEEDLDVTKDNLALIVEAAKKRLDNIIENNEVEAFGVFDVYEEE